MHRSNPGAQAQGTLGFADTPPSGTVPVLLPLPLDAPFDYAVEDPAGWPAGSYVEVPFGPRQVVGVVWDRAAAGRVAPDRLKPVGRRLDVPPMPPALRRLVDHVAAMTLAPLGSALRLAISTPSALEPPVPKLGLATATEASDGIRITPARAKVLTLMADGAVRPSGEIARGAGVSAGVVQSMAKAGLLVAAPLPAAEPPALQVNERALALSTTQADAAAALTATAGRSHGITLLEGVPGAGKTEVYLEAVVAALRDGRQVLVLLPEIALTAQILERFARRFGRAPAMWHSELGSTQRRRTWRRIAEGREPIVVGARSALFLPFSDLGLIVVDEEHDTSFKQDDGVPYHGRDMAVARASFENCPVVLVSATPALETVWRAGGAEAEAPPGLREAAPGWVGQTETDGVSVAHLRIGERFGAATMPAIGLIDLRKDRPPRGRWLAPSLATGLTETFERGEQAMLFLNRRGFAPLTICRACGHRLRCPNCSAWLVTHRLRRRLLCHHCGYGRAELEHCPDCGSVDSLVASGPGVERLAEEAAALWPDARTAILTSDSPSRPSEAAALIAAMHDHELDLLIGTQIIAKGHHFPKLTLVGVVDGDLGLTGGDLRASERQFQLLYQVAGRAGRAVDPGRVLIQTHLPEHPVMQALAAGDKDRFYREELVERRAAGMPPFGRLAAIIVSGRDPNEARQFATRLARSAPDVEGVRVLGPAPAPLALLRGRHRQRLLVIAKGEVDLPEAMRPWLSELKLPGGVRLQVDVDPYSFL